MGISNSYSKILNTVTELENMENSTNNLPMVFAEMFKDEVNAAEENKLYNGVKRVIKKYSDDSKASSAISEFTSVITGGTSLEQIMQIAKDEAVNPTLATELSVDKNEGIVDKG
ncbi:MAG: hypothetical protein ACOX7R_13210 [Acetivibrionales bacterium]|jgi:type II secretory pathway component PulF